MLNTELLVNNYARRVQMHILIVVFCFSTVQNPGLLSDENLPLHVNARGSYGSDGGFAGGSAIDDLGGTNYAGTCCSIFSKIITR